MAAYTSTQSGNWNSTATWGGSGFPGNGDTFTIAANHTVTYNVTTFQTTGIGSGTINNTGRLEFVSGSRMRLAGRIICNGDWIQNSNTIISINNSSTTADIGIRIQIPTTNVPQTVRIVGSSKMPETTVATAVSTTGGSLVGAAALGVSAGDWLSAFKSGLTNITQRTDEGFIVHEVSGNTIYVREFVGPTAVISAQSTNTITVDNARVFRTYQTLIFGFGANRNVRKISSINYDTHVITFTSNLTGTVTGQTAYTTGPIREKNVGDIIRKNATTVTVSALSTATTFTVGNATGYTVGDNVIVDSLLESNNYTDERPEVRTITAVSGNNITVNASFGYPLLPTAFVVNVTRDCVIKTDDDTNSGINYGYFVFYEGTNSASSTRSLKMKDVEFRNLNSNIRDLREGRSPCFNGRYTNELGYDGVEIENITRYCLSNRTIYQNAGIYLYKFCYRWTIRNCVCHESVQGIWFERGYEHDDIAVFNCYSSRAEFSTLRFGDARYDKFEVAYNYGHRSDDALIFITSNRTTGLGFHHNWLRVSQGYGFHSNINYGSFSLFQNKIEGVFGASFYGLNGGMGNFLYNYVIQGAVTDYQPDTSITRDEFGQDPMQNTISLEHNFDIDGIAEYWGGGSRVWDRFEQAWFTQHDDDAFNSSITAGHNEIIYIPAGTTVTIKAMLKLVSNFSGTPPKLSAREILNRGNNTDVNYIVGYPLKSFNTKVDFDNSPDAWQEKTLVISPTEYGKRMSIGIMTQSSDSSEGWYEKPMDVYYDPPLPAEFLSGINKNSASNIINMPGDLKKIRIGGRIK
jgi:hypothetical protein